MGTTMYVEDTDGEFIGLRGHEGFMEQTAPLEWRAACECGWRGQAIVLSYADPWPEWEEDAPDPFAEWERHVAPYAARVQRPTG